MDLGLGWNPKLEAMHADALAALYRPMCAASEFELPEHLDLRGTIGVNDQLHFNSCDGNSVDKCGEIDQYIQNGSVLNLSARFSYLCARLVDGTNDGPDAGASISGGVLGAQKYGMCLEETFPYWQPNQPFSPQIPRIAFDEAQQHRIGSVADIANSLQADLFCGTGQGAVSFGIMWTEGLANYRGGEPITRNLGGRVIGGHALCRHGWRTISGTRYGIVWNSHGSRWGEKGTMLVHPDLWDSWIVRSPFGAKGMSQLSGFQKRPFSWDGLVG